jgi:hypothetical protein
MNVRFLGCSLSAKIFFAGWPAYRPVLLQHYRTASEASQRIGEFMGRVVVVLFLGLSVHHDAVGMPMAFIEIGVGQVDMCFMRAFR